MEVFVQVAERGSLAAAARAMRMSPAAVTRALATLEARLGVELVRRTTRSLHLTEAGHAYLTDAHLILDGVRQADARATQSTSEPQGPLTIAAPVAFGRLHVAPMLARFLALHPKVSGRLILSDRYARMAEDGIDVAIRIGHLKDSALKVRTLTTIRRHAVASPEYLQRRGRPANVADLADHDIVEFSGLMPNNTISFGNDSVTMPETSRLKVNDANAAVDMTAMGCGICVLYSYMTDTPIRTGRLVDLRAPFESAPTPVQLVFAPTISRAARVFIDMAVQSLPPKQGGD